MKNLNIFKKILNKRNNKCYNEVTKVGQKGECFDMLSAVDVVDLSKYIIRYYNNCQKEISNLKLQKILYYIQGYYLKKYKKIAFNSKIYNWPYGPVVKDAYYEFNTFGSRNIVINDEIVNMDIKLRPSLESIVLQILSKCSDISAFDLVEKTHMEDPWKKTKTHQEITTNAIYNYFEKNNPLDIKVQVS